jgi:hypothetical protein
MSKPRPVDITRAHSRRDQRELQLRLAFAGRRPLDVVISFDDVERIARFFGQMATAGQPSNGE